MGSALSPLNRCMIVLWVHSTRENSDMQRLCHGHCASAAQGSPLPQGKSSLGCFSAYCAPVSDISVPKPLCQTSSSLLRSPLAPHRARRRELLKIDARNEGAQLNLVQFGERTQSKQNYNNLKGKKSENLGRLTTFLLFVVCSNFREFLFSFLM